MPFLTQTKDQHASLVERVINKGILTPEVAAKTPVEALAVLLNVKLTKG